MRSISTLLFLLAAALGCGFLGYRLVDADQRLFQPGPLSYAHHLLEARCDSCHDAAFSGDAAIDKRCQSCHGTSMKHIGDAHGPKKFADPRNAVELDILDASRCLSCHKEHVPEQTRAMQVTQPADFCMACHSDIRETRASHLTVEASSCTNSGCHNYHDNSTLYEDFLAAHAKEPAQLKIQKRLPRPTTRKPMLQADWPSLAIAMAQEKGNAAPAVTEDQIQAAVADWKKSSHAKGHANCSDCHREKSSWRVEQKICAECHEPQWQAIQLGHHGMPLAIGMEMTRVDQAMLPMQTEAAEKQIGCNSCHAPHDYDTVRAEAESCLGCHDDKHSQQWRQSKHAALWLADHETGASCAGCHMPREQASDQASVRVQHNQSNNLRPNDKMLKSVCMRCHGLEYAMSALADKEQILHNFSKPASGSHLSMDWVRQHSVTASDDAEKRP